MHANNPNALMLPDAVTELDLFAPLPDPEDLLLDDDERRGPGKDPTLLDFGTSQLLTDNSQTPSRRERTMLEDDIDVDLDFGLEPGEQALRSSPFSEGRSVEVGRRAETPRRDEPTLLDDLDLGLDFGNDGDTTINRGTSLRPPQDDNDMPMLDADDGFQMPPDMDDGIAAANEAAFKRAEMNAARKRDSNSPLSSLRSSMERDLEQTYHLDQNMETEDETMVQAAQRVKRRKIMQPDIETQLHNSQIKRQQEDRSAITKAPTFLSHDPLMLQLMEMQRNGSFVSNLMGDGRMAGWAPELRGILSLEVVRQAGDKKRKRDSGVADVTDDERQETPQLEVPDDDDFPADAGAADFGGDTLRSEGLAPPMSDGLQPHTADDDIPEDFGAGAGSPGPTFDTTEAPLLHPSQAGPVSLGTKNAVHLLRSHFAPNHPADATEPPTPSKRTKTDALFTDLCPEGRTSRQDATKMFFELLVLGTKDAVKVEQESGGGGLGLPIRVRGKRGLWGDWAAREAGGEIAGQGEVEGRDVLPGVEEEVEL